MNTVALTRPIKLEVHNIFTRWRAEDPPEALEQQMGSNKFFKIWNNVLKFGCTGSKFESRCARLSSSICPKAVYRG